MTETSWESAGRTHAGCLRPHNEDAWVARGADGLWMVADGMGGHAAGDRASRMVAEAVGALDAAAPLPEFVDRVDDTLEGANRDIRAWAEAELEGRTMGCTVVALVARGDVGVCLWAGDSRLYRLRGDELLQVSRDHDPFEELVESGELTPEEADARGEASVVTRAIGAAPELHLDVLAFDTAPGDLFLLCSDGLYRELGARELRDLLVAGGSLEALADRLLQGALERGARDNVTVLLARRGAAGASP
jgi:serine/threonine protein phosphatase PrpC